MMRLALLVLCLAAACSTMPPFTVEEYQAPGLDGGSSDAGAQPDAAPRDGSVGPPDAGRFDAGQPSDAARPDARVDGGPEDFDYECTLYGISPRCTPSNPLPPACSGASLGEVCFTLPGFGMAQMFECQPSLSGGRGWVPTNPQRCAYNCPADLPSASFFSLSVDGCARRPSHPCQRGEYGTTQEAIDAVLLEIVQRCNLQQLSDSVSAGITINEQGCPSWFHSSLARVPPMQRRCLSDALEQLRFDCSADCSLAVSTILR